jgi:large subunit ribosomal protein L18
MDRLVLKRTRRTRRIERVRHSIKARFQRPRLVFVRSNRYLAAQIIDDLKGETICAVTSASKSWSGSRKNKEAAKKLGELLGEKAKAKGVEKVVMDRRGILYHGRIAAFADAAREKGLKF